jgi:UDP-N-acetyl-D-glucosamine dehydrogenase
MKVCVIGLGKIGLPLAVQFAKNGIEVIGVDINAQTVELINSGKEPFPGEENLEKFLKEVLESNKFSATTNFGEAIKLANAVVVLVPLIVDTEGKPDFTSIDLATKEIAKNLQKGTLVSYETTLPIGTTRNRFRKILEELSGLKVGKDFNLVFSPERVSSGRIFEDLKNYPKIVGGVTPACTQKGVEFYNQALIFNLRTDLEKPNGVWPQVSSEASEFVKLAETTYRDVNIGLANQFAIHADELSLNIQEIIAAANSQPYSHIHTPGIAVGGHCIPVYPHFYLSTDPKATIVQAARKQNAEIPNYYLNKIRTAAGSLQGLKILILGLAYRANVKEYAFSGALSLVELIKKEGGFPFIADPLYTEFELEQIGLKSRFAANTIDYVILHTSHDAFANFDFDAITSLKGIVDGRNFYSSNLRKMKFL